MSQNADPYEHLFNHDAESEIRDCALRGEAPTAGQCFACGQGARAKLAHERHRLEKQRDKGARKWKAAGRGDAYAAAGKAGVQVGPESAAFDSLNEQPYTSSDQEHAGHVRASNEARVAEGDLLRKTLKLALAVLGVFCAVLFQAWFVWGGWEQLVTLANTITPGSVSISPMVLSTGVIVVTTSKVMFDMRYQDNLLAAGIEYGAMVLLVLYVAAACANFTLPTWEAYYGSAEVGLFDEDDDAAVGWIGAYLRFAAEMMLVAVTGYLFAAIVVISRCSCAARKILREIFGDYDHATQAELRDADYDDGLASVDDAEPQLRDLEVVEAQLSNTVAARVLAIIAPVTAALMETLDEIEQRPLPETPERPHRTRITPAESVAETSPAPDPTINYDARMKILKRQVATLRAVDGDAVRTWVDDPFDQTVPQQRSLHLA